MTFFDNYSFKKKNYVLLLILVLIVVLIYKRSYLVIVDLKTYGRELGDKLIEAENAERMIRFKKGEIVLLDKTIGKENLTVEKVQHGFLTFFGIHANKLKVYRLHEVVRFQHPDFKIYTHEIVLVGDYISALSFIYKLEKDFEMARLVNTSFSLSTRGDGEGGKKQLFITLLLQNYAR